MSLFLIKYLNCVNLPSLLTVKLASQAAQQVLLRTNVVVRAMAVGEGGVAGASFSAHGVAGGLHSSEILKIAE